MASFFGTIGLWILFAVGVVLTAVVLSIFFGSIGFFIKEIADYRFRKQIEKHFLQREEFLKKARGHDR